MIKICATCGKEKNLDLFFRDARNKDGFRNTCKDCSVQSKNYQKNIEIVKEKTCNTCKKLKPLEMFLRDERRTLGYGMVCLECSQMKLCRKCQVKKPLNYFSRSDRSADGFRYSCKECENTKMREKYKEPENRIKTLQRNGKYYHNKNSRDGRRERLLSKHGLTIAQYQEMLEKQEYRCAICKRLEGERGRPKLVVDHNHSNGEVRGLLCDPCNRGIGMLLDDPEILQNAIDYINFPASIHAHFG